MPRVALLFDNTPRPETTGFYVRRALSEFTEVEHFLPSEFDELRRGDHGRFDFAVAIDDGLDYEIPDLEVPCAFWAIDTHVSFAQVLKKAQACDVVFAAQNNGAEGLRAAGLPTAEWLPLACDPAFHRPHPAMKTWDVCFVGHVLQGPRAELLDVLRSRHPGMFVGQRFGQEMSEIYSASRIVWNRSVGDDVNMRVFEALACGSLLVTNDLSDNGQEELFQTGVHCLTYRGRDDLLDRVAWALAHVPERERLATAGRLEALERHTYRHRVERILRALERQPSSVAAAVPVPAGAKARPQDPGYFEWARPEVLALIPESARRVLEIGCGAGRLGASLKSRQQAHVTGIEMDAGAADAARHLLDEVLCADAESSEITFPDHAFDTVVCADVLEHLRVPERLLARIRRWLEPGGTLVASLPNIQHHSVVTSLLEGNFTYESAGLLDATHLRFFTRREIEKLLFRTGFHLESLQSVPGPADSEWWQSPSPEVRIGGFHMTGLDPERAKEFFTYQYLVTARSEPPRSDGLTSILLVTHNQLAYTRLCLDSVRRFTDEPYELIVVDNGSKDRTPEFLANSPDIRWIGNPDNRGFPAAVNQGIGLARGTQILLLNNDTVVTTGWLRRMLKALQSDAVIGLVGPVSNRISGLQQIPVTYRQMADLDGFAWDWGRDHAGEIVDLERLVGFCLLINRRVIEEIGGLDERFGIGNFEDDDYCRRAREAGFRTVVAVDSFVHHFGGRTFVGSGVDFAALMAENERKYREKWAEQSRPVPADAAVGATRSAPRPARRVSLCMIVRDNERTIRPCLESIRPWVDEMIVVDTGSTDQTPEICRSLGAKVFEFPWCDDFSAARNQSVSHARGEWIFWMDSDDTISAECGRKLRDLADSPHAEQIMGYVMQVHCPSPGNDGANDMTVVDHVKLFRNRPDLRFEHRIHEQILPAIRRAGGEVEFTDIHVVHSGSDHSSEGRARKLERDFRLLELDARERPDHPFVLFNLGMTYNDAGRHTEAVDVLQRCLAVSTPGESHLRKAYALLVASLGQMRDRSNAFARCFEALRMFPDDPELLFRRGLLHHDAGQLEEAATVYTRLLNLGDSGIRVFSSRDPEILGLKARHNLALVYEETGDLGRAAEQWRLMTQDNPNGLSGWKGLAELLLREQRGSDVAQVVDRFREAPHPVHRAFARYVAGRLAELEGDELKALRAYEESTQLDPLDLSSLRQICRIHFERGRWNEARASLEGLAERTPDDASVFHNLGIAYSNLGRHKEASECWRHSLHLRPDYGPTIDLLADGESDR